MIPHPQKPPTHTSHGRLSSFRRAFAIPLTTSLCRDALSPAPGKARTTHKDPMGKSFTQEENAARMRRAVRWRTTELPTALPIVRPTRGSSKAPVAKTCKTTAPDGIRTPRRVVSRNWGADRIRFDAGNITSASGGEALAALRPTGGEDAAASTGTHTSPEAVGLGPTTGIGLESALHGRTPALVGISLLRLRPLRPFGQTGSLDTCCPLIHKLAKPQKRGLSSESARDMVLAASPHLWITMWMSCGNDDEEWVNGRGN